jgi:hypothetical protein
MIVNEVIVSPLFENVIEFMATLRKHSSLDEKDFISDELN